MIEMLVVGALGLGNLGALLVTVHHLRKDHRADVDAALALAHQVATDAFVHLKSQTPLQAVQTVAASKTAEAQAAIDAETQRWLLERQRKEMEEAEKRLAELPRQKLTLNAIGEDGVSTPQSVDMRDFTIEG
jgi:hypothetical protein